MFRFDYAPEFLKWALMPPGWLPQWHVGVRVAKSGKLGQLLNDKTDYFILSNITSRYLLVCDVVVAVGPNEFWIYTLCNYA